mmetsp:Transcript_35470/g.66868  ORF Transcript_35470/g.66868 Transcript_35470/m.66868 type:complete len:156 (+) Transcript_35470:49-516(+)
MWAFATGGLMPQVMMMEAGFVHSLTVVMQLHRGQLHLQRAAVGAILTVAGGGKSLRRDVINCGGRSAVHTSFQQHPELGLRHLLQGPLKDWDQAPKSTTFSRTKASLNQLIRRFSCVGIGPSMKCTTAQKFVGKSLHQRDQYSHVRDAHTCEMAI